MGSRGLVGAGTCVVVADGAVARIRTDGVAAAARLVDVRSTGAEEGRAREEGDNSF